MCHRSCVVFPHGVSGRGCFPSSPRARPGPRLLDGEGAHGTARRGASTGRDGTYGSAWRSHGGAHGGRRREVRRISSAWSQRARDLRRGERCGRGPFADCAARTHDEGPGRPPRASESVSERLRGLAVGGGGALRALDACGAPEQGTTRCDGAQVRPGPAKPESPIGREVRAGNEARISGFDQGRQTETPACTGRIQRGNLPAPSHPHRSLPSGEASIPIGEHLAPQYAGRRQSDPRRVPMMAPTTTPTMAASSVRASTRIGSCFGFVLAGRSSTV